MARWFTSDEHLGHDRIRDLAHRPFDNTEAMNKEIIARFNESVKPEDRTIHLGDFALGVIAKTLPLVGELNGSHVLMPGNHDRCWPGSSNGDKLREWRISYVRAGFSVLSGFAEVPVYIGEEPVLISHFPYHGDSREMAERFPEWRPKDTGMWLLHGHVHERWRQRGRMINVGVDAWGGRPVSREQIAELITAGPRDLEPLPW